MTEIAERRISRERRIRRRMGDGKDRDKKIGIRYRRR
jgi:hypothetical protein